MCITKDRITHDCSPSKTPASPYSGGRKHLEIEHIIEEGKQSKQEAQPSPAGEQSDGGDEGEDDDIRSGGDYGAPAGYVRGNPTSPLLSSSNPVRYRPVPLGSALPPPPSGAAVATPPSDDGDNRPSSGIYDGLAKLDPNTIIDKVQLACMFGVSEKTIRRRVDAGGLPLPHMRMRRQPAWFAGILLDWLKGKARHSAEQEEARRQHIRDRTGPEPNT